MLSLERSEWTHLKCHFGGLAIQVSESEKKRPRSSTSDSNPKAAKFSVDAATKASYKATAELAYSKYGISSSNGSDKKNPSDGKVVTPDALSKARQKVIETLRQSSGIYQVSDLFAEGPTVGPSAEGTFAPIFFASDPPSEIKSQYVPDRDYVVRKFYFVYNGSFLIVAASCQNDKEIFALSETVTKISLLLTGSGFEFHWLSPIPTRHAIDFGNVSTASTPTSGALNNSSKVGRIPRSTTLANMPRSVRDVLRLLYIDSFPYMMSLYSLTEQSNSEEALIQTIKAHREAILDLMEEFNKSNGYFHRRKLKGLIRTHSVVLTEKIGRLGALSDSLNLGIASLDNKLRNYLGLKAMLEKEPNWKSSLRHEFDAKPTLDLIARALEDLS